MADESKIGTVWGDDELDAIIARYNADASPFAWTKTAVHQKRFKGRRISQL